MCLRLTPVGLPNIHEGRHPRTGRRRLSSGSRILHTSQHQVQTTRGSPCIHSKNDSVPSDIDVMGINPHKRGPSRVWLVNCKSWQSGFNVRTKLEELKQNKIVSGRESWRFFRELMVPKWSEGFRDTVLRETGLRAFTYVTAVTRLSGDRSEWEQLSRFRKAMGGNPIRLLPYPRWLRMSCPA